MKEVKYLGHIITPDGIKPDPEKIRDIVNYPLPRNVKDVRAFLGLAGWYRKFIPNFAEVAAPLSKLTKKDVVFKIDEEVRKSMDSLKIAITSDSVLIYPDFNDTFILATDASGIGVGAILSQNRGGLERPVAFASKKLNKAEQNYSTIERELLGIIFGIKQFRCYLYGRRFTIITDHRPLKWILSLKDPTSRLARWALLLAEYEFDVIHRPGKKTWECRRTN